MKTITLLVFFWITTLNVSAQDLNFSTASPAWNNADQSKTYSNIGSPSITSVTAAYSGNLNFAGVTFPSTSAAGLRTQMNFTSNTQKVVFTVTFSSAVGLLSFNISEIDKATNNVNYIDRVRVTGYSGVTAVNPSFTSVSTHATAAGNVITGVSQDNTSTPSTVSFGSDVDRIVIEYDNADGTQADPSNQEINIGNMSWEDALPVHLISFNAKSDQGRGKLNWTTSWEQNSDHFLIQKTNDFKLVQTVGSVASVGSSQVANSYEWIDEALLEAITYYRLVQVDYDGTSTESKWVAVRDLEEMITLYPNPVVDGFYVKSASKVSNIVLTDLSGRTLKTFEPQPFYNGLENLSSGAYAIKVTMQDGSIIHKKITK